jgi:glycosyltransferase involved in cell wall biosynthesis
VAAGEGRLSDGEDAERGDLVCLAEIAWGYFRTRKQFLLSRLAKRWRVIYFEPVAFGRGGGASARTVDGLTVATVPFLKPGTSVPAYNAAVATPMGRALVERVAGWSLSGWMRRLGIRRPVCVISNVYAVNLLGIVAPRLVCYDFNDHPRQFPTAPDWTDSYLRRLLGESDVVVAVSEPYQKELASLTKAPVVLIENGVEFERFAHPASGPPPALAALPRPRLGYVGKLSTFLDVPLLEKVASTFPHPLVLAGPIPAEMREQLQPLLARPNVHYLGELPYDRVPGFLSGLDVGLVPFRAGDPFVERINPNKLYQYLAAGLPMVSSPMEGIAGNGAGLFFASDHEQFLSGIRRVLEGRVDKERLRDLARDHDWDALADRMDQVLLEQAARRRQRSS